MSTYEITKQETKTARGETVSWPPYHWIDEPVEPILANFWQATHDEHDLEQHQRFIKMLQLRNEGGRDSEIARKLNANNVGKYLSGEKKSFVTHLRLEHDRLGTPRQGYQWLPMRLKPRGTPDTEWIEVPTEILEYNDILRVIQQLAPTENSFGMMEQFEYKSVDELMVDRPKLFCFFGGTVAGDASKPEKGSSRFPSMATHMTLSKAKQNSYRFGEFASLCANASLGLTVHRISDAPSSDQRYTDAECFRWISPASPLIAWTFRVFLGLKEGARTTCDPVRMGWLLNAPKEFKVHFLQGLLESDGWVNPGSDRVVFVSSPNEKLLMGLLQSLDIPCHLYTQSMITRIEFETELGLPLPIFNERIHSNSYDNLVTMATAKRFPPRRALPDLFLTQIRPILSKKTKHTEACLEIAKTTGYKITDATVKKYRNTLTD